MKKSLIVSVAILMVVLVGTAIIPMFSAVAPASANIVDSDRSAASNAERPSNVTDSDEVPTLSNRSSLATTSESSSPQEYVVVVESDSRMDTDALARFGRVGTVAGTRVELTMVSTNVSQVRSLPWVQQVHGQIVPAEPATDSFNVSTVGADRVHEIGISGEKVDIGVIGVGSDTTDVPYEDQIVAVRNFKTEPFDADPDHDTAATEQLAEVAPGANLYLTGVKSSVDFAAAVDYLITQDVDIILTEVAYYGTVGDGTSFIANQVENANASDIAVITPVGNSRMSHYRGEFTDPDGDSVHEFSAEDETNRLGGEAVDVSGLFTFYLTWSDFDSDTISDYSLSLWHHGEEEYVASSTPLSSADDQPAERLQYRTDGFEPLSLVIRHHSGDTADTIELHGPDWTRGLEHLVPERSIVPPATAPSAVGVAAYNSNTDEIAAYSAEGPVGDHDGVTVAGPSHLPASPFPSGFTGTSGAGPYVAGTTALMEEAHTNELGTPTIRQTLRDTADDLPAPSTRDGGGLVNASEAVSAVSSPSSESMNATRSISNTSVAPGGTTVVTLSVNLSETSSDFRISETFDPAFDEVAVVDDDDALLTSTKENGSEVFGSWSGVSEVTLQYEVTVPDNATEGDEFTLNGTATDNDAGDTVNVSGDRVITVAAGEPGGGDGDDDESSGDSALTATRTINKTEISAGGTTEVTVTADANGTSSDFRISETFDPAFASVSITNSDGATVSSATDAGDELFASWGGISEVTLVYSVTLPDDAEPGTNFTISGTATDADRGTEISPTGNATITAVESDPAMMYTRDNRTVDTVGLANAARDFRDGDISPAVLARVAAAFRSGEPIS